MGEIGDDTYEAEAEAELLEEGEVPVAEGTEFVNVTP